MLAAMGVVRAVSDSAFAPALLFVIACAIGLPLSATRVRIPWRWLSAAVLCVVVAAAITYLVLPVLFEDPETNIACVSAVAMAGRSDLPCATGGDALLIGLWPFNLSRTPSSLLGVRTFVGELQVSRDFSLARDAWRGLSDLSPLCNA